MNALPASRFAAGLLVMLWCVGCHSGDARVRVTGKVTYHGEPVGDQTLVLVSEGADGEFSAQRMPLQPDGTFAGEVDARGTYKVVIEESLAVQEGVKLADKGKKPIPVKYRSRTTTTLTWPVGDAENYKEFDLPD
jgi:hypothetical protein